MKTPLERRKAMLAGFHRAPESQLDPTICARIAALPDGPEARAMLKTILDDCAYAALASDFVMMALDIVWREDTLWS
jgi:hypothetical protein